VLAGVIPDGFPETFFAELVAQHVQDERTLLVQMPVEELDGFV
jgi:hypothetical protein